MKFLNLTVEPHRETDITLKQFQNLIFLGTGRQLVLEDPFLYYQNEDYFKLVRFPDPIGFTIVANKKIPKNTTLCFYGGDNITDETTQQNIAYLLRCAGIAGISLTQQAEKSGDIGALFAHLPDQAFLTELGVDIADQTKIQTENVEVTCIPSNGKLRLGLASSTDIEPGSIIGFNYGLHYWVEIGASPVFFQKNSIKPIASTELAFKNPLAVLCTENNNPRLFDVQAHTANSRTSALSLFFFYNRFQTPSTSEQTVLYQDKNTTISVALDRTTFNETLAKTRITNQKADSKQAATTQPFIFFKTKQVIGCAPPPESVFENNKTVLPTHKA